MERYHKVFSSIFSNMGMLQDLHVPNFTIVIINSPGISHCLVHLSVLLGVFYHKFFTPKCHDFICTFHAICLPDILPMVGINTA